MLLLPPQPTQKSRQPHTRGGETPYMHDIGQSTRAVSRERRSSRGRRLREDLLVHGNRPVHVCRFDRQASAPARALRRGFTCSTPRPTPSVFTASMISRPLSPLRKSPRQSRPAPGAVSLRALPGDAECAGVAFVNVSVSLRCRGRTGSRPCVPDRHLARRHGGSGRDRQPANPRHRHANRQKHFVALALSACGSQGCRLRGMAASASHAKARWFWQTSGRRGAAGHFSGACSLQAGIDGDSEELMRRTDCSIALAAACALPAVVSAQSRRRPPTSPTKK